MGQLEFKCPQCGQNIEANDALRGQVAECPSCGKGIVIPRINNVTSPQSKSIIASHVQAPKPTLKPQLSNVQTTGAVPRAQTHYESMMEAEALRRRKEKSLDFVMFLVKAIAAVLFVCIAGWVVNTTWKKMKDAERQSLNIEREEEFNRKIKEMEGKVAVANKALEGMNNAVAEEREHAEKTKAEYHKNLDELKRSHQEELEKLKVAHRKEFETMKALYEKQHAKGVPSERNVLGRNQSGDDEEEGRKTRKMEKCGRCSGKGEIQKKVRCLKCGGSGRIKETTKRWVGGDYFRSGREKLSTSYSDCPFCLPGVMRGSGSKGYTIETETCPKCDGKGKILLDD